jgi:hypothetical protein
MNLIPGLFVLNAMRTRSVRRSVHLFSSIEIILRAYAWNADMRSSILHVTEEVTSVCCVALLRCCFILHDDVEPNAKYLSRTAASSYAKAGHVFFNRYRSIILP